MGREVWTLRRWSGAELTRTATPSFFPATSMCRLRRVCSVPWPKEPWIVTWMGAKKQGTGVALRRRLLSCFRSVGTGRARRSPPRSTSDANAFQQSHHRRQVFVRRGRRFHRVVA
jgi:hypothetical protein